MNGRTTIGVALIAAFFIAACATSPAEFRGDVLTDSKGMTLYTFDKDPVGAGRSVCNGRCAANWPPLMANADAKASGPFTVIARDDGAKQWAYDGKPLYLWVKDKKPGDRTGDGVRNVWHVVKQPVRESGY